MNEPTMTIIGNLTADPDLRHTASGDAVASITIASTPRRFNKQSGEYEDGETLFMRATLWRQLAENAEASLTKGSRVVAEGLLKQRSFETKEGEKRTVVEMTINDIGPSLRNAVAQVQRSQGNQTQQRNQQAQQQQQQAQTWYNPGEATENWNAQQAQQQAPPAQAAQPQTQPPAPAAGVWGQGGNGGAFDDESPF